MDDFFFSLHTRINFGVGVVEQVGMECTDLGASKVLLVTDSGVEGAGLLEPVLDSLRDADIEVEVFKDVFSNPTVENVEQAAELGWSAGCEAIVAVGGGSPIDTAKGAACLVKLGGRPLDYEGWEEIPGEPLPIVAVPTTAGTGSEVSVWAVITAEDHRKTVIGSTKIAPTVALLDPEMTYTLPRHLTAYTGLDALTHAIEAYTSSRSNPMSDALAISAVERIGRSFRRTLESPRDEQARSEMLVASTMAAMAFNSADLGAVHCMSEAVGAQYGIHHGLANAIVLTTVMAYNAPAVSRKYADIAHALGAEHDDGVKAVEALTEDLELPSLADVGVEEEDLDELVRLAAENVALSTNPRPVTEEDFRELFREAM